MRNLSRGLLIIAFSLLLPAPCFGSAVLSQIDVSKSGEVKLAFSGAIDKGKIQTDFMDDIIQVSLNDVTVYPAKIIPVNGDQIVKVFAYQFSPRQVRCRVTIKGKAEDYRSRIQLMPDGNSLLLKMDSSPKMDGKKKVGDELDEDLLLDKVLNSGSSHIGSPAAATSKPPVTLTNGGSLPPMGPAFIKVAFVLALLSGLGIAAKNIKTSKWKLFAKASNSKSGKMVEVLSTQYLGPKKAITVVRIAGRVLVLGVTDESIQLITEIGEPGENTVPDAGFSDFSNILTSEKIKPSNMSSDSPNFDKHTQGVRSMIRSRLEELKPL